MYHSVSLKILLLSSDMTNTTTTTTKKITKTAAWSTDYIMSHILKEHLNRRVYRCLSKPANNREQINAAGRSFYAVSHASTNRMLLTFAHAEVQLPVKQHIVLRTHSHVLSYLVNFRAYVFAIDQCSALRWCIQSCQYWTITDNTHNKVHRLMLLRLVPEFFQLSVFIIHKQAW